MFNRGSPKSDHSVFFLWFSGILKQYLREGNGMRFPHAIAVMGVLLATGKVASAEGFYVSGELGLAIASGFDITGSSNDRASVCDEYINPSYDEVESSAGYSDYNCTGPDRGATGDWQNEFDSAHGVLAGATVGYGFGNGFRFEIEYFYRESDYDETSDIPGGSGESGDKLEQEIRTATDRVGTVDSHNLFANLLYDFRNETKFTPYLGIGGGLGFTSMEYGSVWGRNPDAARIMTGDGLPNQAEIRRNLAGAVSVAQTTLDDTLLGFQVLAGVDYEISDSVSLGVKGRWARFESFEDGGVVWDPLRSHAPNIRLDGSEPVSGFVETDEIEFFGMGVNLKFFF